MEHKTSGSLRSFPQTKNLFQRLSFCSLENERRGLRAFGEEIKQKEVSQEKTGPKTREDDARVVFFSNDNGKRSGSAVYMESKVVMVFVRALRL